MPVTVHDSGSGNVVETSAAVRAEQTGSIRLRGDNNRVLVGAIRNGKNFSIDVGSSCRVDIADLVWIGGLRLYCDVGPTVTIASYVGFNGGPRRCGMSGPL